jgi:hypothetical protein
MFLDRKDGHVLNCLFFGIIAKTCNISSQINSPGGVLHINKNKINHAMLVLSKDNEYYYKSFKTEGYQDN